MDKKRGKKGTKSKVKKKEEKRKKTTERKIK